MAVPGALYDRETEIGANCSENLPALLAEDPGCMTPPRVKDLLVAFCSGSSPKDSTNSS